VELVYCNTRANCKYHDETTKAGGFLKAKGQIRHGYDAKIELIDKLVQGRMLSCEIAVEDCILLQLVITNGNLV